MKKSIFKITAFSIIAVLVVALSVTAFALTAPGGTSQRQATAFRMPKQKTIIRT